MRTEVTNLFSLSSAVQAPPARTLTVSTPVDGERFMLTASPCFSPPFVFRCLYLRSTEGGREWDGLNISNLISGAGKQRTP